MKKIIILSAIFLGIFFMFSHKVQASVFVAHLYYIPAQQLLKFDNAYSEKVLVDNQKIISVFDFSDESKPGKYIAELYDDNETILISGAFDAKTDAFSLEVPYISIANSLKIFDKASGKEILSANLDQFVTCNKNNICEFEKGETTISCLVDCATSNPTYSQTTSELLKQNRGIIKDSETGAVLLQSPTLIQSPQQTTATPGKITYYLLILLAVMLFAVAGYLIYKKFIKK